MAKFWKTNLIDSEKNKLGEACWFHCPGCDETHQIYIEHTDSRKPIWGFNGDIENPTVTPSILVGIHNFTKHRCHSFIKDGKIQFLNDCHHKLAGKTVDLPEWDHDY